MLKPYIWCMDRFQHLQNLLAAEPEDSFLNYALALEYSNKNELITAIELIEKVLQRDEHYLGAYLQLGGLYEKTAQVDKAKVIYEKGISIAHLQKNRKAKGELTMALELLDD
jgi:Tfp pilus assembly protein PilF